MKNFYAVFPQIICNQAFTLNSVEFEPLPIGSKQVVAVKLKTEEKSRELKVCEAYFNFYASLIAGVSIKSVMCSEDFFCTIQPHLQQIQVQELISAMPKELEPSAISVYWFSHYLNCANDDLRAQTFALFNALGSLENGYSGIHGSGKDEEENNLLDKLCTIAQEYQMSDDYEDLCPVKELTPLEIVTIRAIFTRLLYKQYPVLKI